MFIVVLLISHNHLMVIAIFHMSLALILEWDNNFCSLHLPLHEYSHNVWWNLLVPRVVSRRHLDSMRNCFTQYWYKLVAYVSLHSSILWLFVWCASKINKECDRRPWATLFTCLASHATSLFVWDDIIIFMLVVHLYFLITKWHKEA